MFNRESFYFKVKFGYLGFCTGEMENYFIFANCCILRSQSWFKHLTELVYEVKGVSREKSFFARGPLARGHIFQINTFFSETVRSFEINVHMKT